MTPPSSSSNHLLTLLFLVRLHLALPHFSASAANQGWGGPSSCSSSSNPLQSTEYLLCYPSVVFVQRSRRRMAQQRLSRCRFKWTQPRINEANERQPPGHWWERRPCNSSCCCWNESSCSEKVIHHWFISYFKRDILPQSERLVAELTRQHHGLLCHLFKSGSWNDPKNFEYLYGFPPSTILNIDCKF